MRTGPVDQNVASLKHLRALLLNVTQGPKEFLADSDLHNALKTQHSLSKYASSDRSITPSSVNTQKRLSAKLLKDEVFEDGYEGLDELRCKAAEQLRAAALVEHKTKKSKRSVAGLSEKVTELKETLSVARQDCWHLSSAFARAISEAENLAADSHDAALQARWAKSRRQLLSMVTLSSRGSYCTAPAVNTKEGNV